MFCTHWLLSRCSRRKVITTWDLASMYSSSWLGGFPQISFSSISSSPQSAAWGNGTKQLTNFCSKFNSIKSIDFVWDFPPYKVKARLPSSKSLFKNPFEITERVVVDQPNAFAVHDFLIWDQFRHALHIHVQLDVQREKFLDHFAAFRGAGLLCAHPSHHGNAHSFMGLWSDCQGGEEDQQTPLPNPARWVQSRWKLRQCKVSDSLRKNLIAFDSCIRSNCSSSNLRRTKWSSRAASSILIGNFAFGWAYWTLKSLPIWRSLDRIDSSSFSVTRHPLASFQMISAAVMYFVILIQLDDVIPKKMQSDKFTNMTHWTASRISKLNPILHSSK